MPLRSLNQRYELFCREAKDLLNTAGLARPEQKPTITGRAFLEACNRLAAIHFPEDKEVGGTGPRGLLWGMYRAVEPSSIHKKDPDPVAGAQSIALVLKQIIKRRPPICVEKRESATVAPAPKNAKNVFIVHGTDSALKDAVARFVSKIGLCPIILHEQPNRGRTIIEKFLDYSDVGFAIALLTADDKGGLVDVSPEGLKPRARQNVILELGFFLGRLGRERVATIFESSVEMPSDYGGVLYIPYDAQGLWILRLAKEMKAIGLEVNLNKL